MRSTRHAARGTTYLKVAMDVARPGDVLIGGPLPRHWSVPWLRPLLALAAIGVAVGALLVARPW